MYRFDLNRCIKSANFMGEMAPIHKKNLYIPVFHTNWRSPKDMVGVVMNCLVGMGL